MLNKQNNKGGYHPFVEETERQNQKYLTYFNYLNRTLPLCIEDVKNSLREGRAGINEVTFLLACIPESFKRDINPNLQSEINKYNHQIFILEEAYRTAITKKQRAFILQKQIQAGQSLSKLIISFIINLLEAKHILDPTKEAVPTSYMSIWEGEDDEPEPK